MAKKLFPFSFKNLLFFRFDRKSVIDAIKRAILIIVGIMSAGLGLESFLLPNEFIDGGVTGISLLIVNVTGWSLAPLIIIVNIPFIWLGYRQVSPMFAFKTALAILGLSLCITFVHFPILTKDKLLIAVFGGFFLGAGIGLAIRGGSVIDGTEVLALYISRQVVLTFGDTLLMINIIIFSVAAYLLGLETALYSILTYFSASRTVDFIVQGIEEYTGVTIISDRSAEIRETVLKNLGRGVTIYKGKSGYNQRDIDIIFTVVTRLEITKLRNEISRIDDKAFMIEQTINDTHGGMIKKRPLH
jgi:uncharacterized membrane-anchored protein YitT (DUF2179 family)